MAKSKVWFSDANATNWTESLACKAKDLFYEAGLDKCISKGDAVAVKIHVGEWNRTRCLRPELVAAIVEEVKAVGGRPFVTDTTTLPYHAYNSRINATLELETAYRHGFTPEALGCPLVIADGLSGCDDVRVDLPEGIVLKEAYVASGIATADALINLAHGKGHPITSFGGAIKNIGIGGQSKRGKFVEHLAHWGEPGDAIGWPLSDPSACAGLKCDFHKQCMDGCHAGAITIDEKGFHRNNAECRLCYGCQVTCIFTGHTSQGFRPEYFAYAQIGMSDAANAVLKCFDEGKVGHMVYAIDTDPNCDCIPWATLPVSPDIGVFASKDIVALDSAVLDKINAAPMYPGGANNMLEDAGAKPGESKFTITQSTPPTYQLTAAQKLGMGAMDYELITYEPPMTREHIAKWQIRQEPTALILREIWKKHSYVKEVEPFKRTAFDINIYKTYGPSLEKEDS
ncbi:MAG: DUF362 domain-containing protein [Clostridia bacterium]|nr:DUF362 domain-containing protein [Clostridia bacterium]